MKQASVLLTLQIEAPQFSWLWIITFFINVTVLSFLDLKKLKTKKWVFLGHSLAHLTETQKYSPDAFAYRHYRHQTTRFLPALPSWGHCLHSLLPSWTLTSVGNPSNIDHSLSFHCSSVGKLATSAVENTTTSSQRASVLISQHSQDKTNRPWLR